MTQYHDERLAGWLIEGPHHGSVDALEHALASARSTRQRPAWVIRLSGGSFSEGPTATMLRYAVVAAAVVALVALLVGALIVGGSLPPPVPPVEVDRSDEPSPLESVPQPSEPPSGLVAYTVTEDLQPGEGRCTSGAPPSLCQRTRAWVSDTSGLGAHLLFPQEDGGDLIGWAPDGGGIVYRGEFGPELTDPTGSQRLALGDEDLCVYPCAGVDWFAVSPDGTRVAFVRAYPDIENQSVVAILDLTSGQVTELESTRTRNGSIDEQCWLSSRCEGLNETPRWSPDSSRLAFARQVMSPDGDSPWESAAVFVVNADGSDLLRLTPPGSYAFDPNWSPDGSTLVFVNTEQIVNADRTSVTAFLQDIYTVRPDGTELRRLTSDGISLEPNWTSNSRVNFARFVVPDANELENWIMDADGGSQSTLGTSLAELTAAGCITCAYPLPAGQYATLRDAYWQPSP